MVGKAATCPVCRASRPPSPTKNFAVIRWGISSCRRALPFFNGALLFYIDTLLGLNESFATIVLAISIVVGICTHPLVNALVRRFGKKAAAAGRLRRLCGHLSGASTSTPPSPRPSAPRLWAPAFWQALRARGHWWATLRRPS